MYVVYVPLYVQICIKYYCTYSCKSISKVVLNSLWLQENMQMWTTQLCYEFYNNIAWKYNKFPVYGICTMYSDPKEQRLFRFVNLNSALTVLLKWLTALLEYMDNSVIWIIWVFRLEGFGFASVRCMSSLTFGCTVYFIELLERASICCSYVWF